MEYDREMPSDIREFRKFPFKFIKNLLVEARGSFVYDILKSLLWPVIFAGIVALLGWVRNASLWQITATCSGDAVAQPAARKSRLSVTSLSAVVTED
jgi:hypothetical protein